MSESMHEKMGRQHGGLGENPSGKLSVKDIALAHKIGKDN